MFPSKVRFFIFVTTTKRAMPYFIDETVLSHPMNHEENCNLSFQQIKNLLFQTVNFFL